MRICFLAATLAIGLVAAQTAAAVVYGGVDFPQGDVSFADAVLSYDPASGGGSVPTDPNYVNPDRAIGPPDFVGDANGSGGEFNGTGAVALGDGGRLELLFADNVVTNAAGGDLAIFERGVAEAFSVAVRPSQTTRALLGAQCASEYCALGTWTPVNDVVQIDLDAMFIGAFPPHTLRFDAVQLTDLKGQGGSTGDKVGADIDAVGGIASDAIVCGDGRVEGAEECDDSGVADGDGCSATCKIETCWTCAPATEPSVCTVNGGGPCDDGEPCTMNDFCGGPSGTTCIGGPPPDCDDGNVCTDDSCVDGVGCASVPNTASCDDGSDCSAGDHCLGKECVGTAVEASNCRVSLGATQLRLLNRLDDEFDAFVWTWPKGEETQLSAFGTPPLPGGSYELCIFDGPPASRRLRAVARADKAQLCGGRSCWHAKGDIGFLFKNPAAPYGMRQLFLKGGATGKAKIFAKGRGAALHVHDDATMTLPVRVQLRDTSSDECWEAVYTDALSNDANRFKAKR